MSDRKRIVFVNLHSDWMLVKSASVYVFKFSAAIKHGYLMKYLLKHPEYEICNYINDRGFSWLRNNNDTFMKFLNLFRFPVLLPFQFYAHSSSIRCLISLCRTLTSDFFSPLFCQLCRKRCFFPDICFHIFSDVCLHLTGSGAETTCQCLCLGQLLLFLIHLVLFRYAFREYCR